MSRVHFVTLRAEFSFVSFASLAESILAQDVDVWDWTIDKASISSFSKTSLMKRLRKDKRVHISDLPLFEKATSFEEQVNLADSRTCTFVSAGTRLSTNFVGIVKAHQIATCNDGQELDVLYPNVRLIGEGNNEVGTWEKPQYSPERLMHQDYLSGAALIRTDLVQSACRQSGLTYGQIEQAAILQGVAEGLHFRHVFEPIISLPISTATGFLLETPPGRIQYAAQTAKHLGIGFVIAKGPTGKWVLRRLPKEKVKVSVVIPTRGDKKRIWGIETDLIENVVESVVRNTSYEDFEIIVVHDTNSSYEEHARSLGVYGERVRMVPFSKAFNFSEKCNIGVAHSTANVIVLLNDDIEVIDSWWLDHMVAYLESPEVGMVGPVLLLDNRNIQSAGHVNQPLPANYFAGRPLGMNTFPEPLDTPCEVSGLTAACVAIRKSVFDEVGGLCEELPNNFNDVDLCLKVQQTGRTLIWTPLARLYHFETLTRTTTVTEAETKFIMNRWGRMFGADLYRSRVN